jgi:hypothetical protein
VQWISYGMQSANYNGTIQKMSLYRQCHLVPPRLVEFRVFYRQDTIFIRKSFQNNMPIISNAPLVDIMSVLFHEDVF